MRAFFPALLFVVLVLFFSVGLRLDPSEIPSPLIGKPAPAFALPALKAPQTTISEDSLKGEVTLLNVWATWCVGCRQEHETLLAIAQSGEVPIYGLNYKDERGAARQWLAQLGDPYVANAFDEFGKAGIEWGVYGAPETFLIDADGVVRYKHIGPLNLGIWTEELLPRVREAKRRSGS
ncbi:MAG: DsbE family thiol:disulfide interchange protein [Pseudomonadota bacterium]